MATSVKKNLYWNTLLRIPVRIICFFLSIFVARLLDPADFGIMAITMMCIGYANLVTNFGLNEAIIQQTITCKKTINSIFTVDIAISIFLAVIFAAGAGIIAGFFHEERSQTVIRVMSMVFVITSFSGIPTVLLRRDNNFKMLAWLEMSKSLATSVLTLLLAFFHFGYWALAYGQLVPLIVFTIVICVQTKWSPWISFQFKLLKPVIHFGWWSFLRTQTNFLVHHVEQIVVGRMLGSYSLGIYDKSKSIAVVPSESILMNINSVMFSSFSNNKYKEEVLRDHFARSICLISIISFPIYIGFILISPYFVSVLLGDKWFEMIIPLQIVLTGYLFKSFGGLLTSFNVAVGRYKNQALLTMVSGCVLTILCFWLVKYGIIGISIAFLVFCFVEFIFYIFLSFAALKLRWTSLFKFIFTGTWSSFVMFMVVKIVSIQYLSNHIVMNIIFIIIVGFIVYSFCIYVDRTEMSKDIKRNIFRDLKSLMKR